MDKQNLQFEIEQLRKDKIIYGVEACATVLACMLVSMYADAYFSAALRELVHTLVLLIGVGYTIFMGVGNYKRLKKIQKLQRQLR